MVLVEIVQLIVQVHRALDSLVDKERNSALPILIFVTAIVLMRKFNDVATRNPQHSSHYREE